MLIPLSYPYTVSQLKQIYLPPFLQRSSGFCPEVLDKNIFLSQWDWKYPQSVKHNLHLLLKIQISKMLKNKKGLLIKPQFNVFT